MKKEYCCGVTYDNSYLFVTRIQSERRSDLKKNLRQTRAIFSVVVCGSGCGTFLPDLIRKLNT
jgi:hypothetical protein